MIQDVLRKKTTTRRSRGGHWWAVELQKLSLKFGIFKLRNKKKNQQRNKHKQKKEMLVVGKKNRWKRWLGQQGEKRHGISRKG